MQAACLRLGVEASSFLQGEALKIFLQDYWLFFYALPLLTTGLIFKDLQDASLSALIRGPEQQCLVAYSEGKTAWRYNQFAYFFRRRRILYLLVSTVVIFLGLHIVFSPELSPAARSATLLALTFLFFGADFFVLHRRTVCQLDMQKRLHQLAHQLRNEHSQLLRRFSGKEKASAEDCLSYLSATLTLTGDYLRTVMSERGENNVELALRAALPHQEEQGNISYYTLARTHGLQESIWLSDPVSANQGIARCLIEERDTCNVLVYRDMHKALRKKVFPEAESFAETVGSMAIAPLKAWDGKKKSMIGILYLVSGEKKAFREEHIDAIRFLADILADALASSVTVNYMLIMKGNKNARRRQLLEKY